MEANQSCHEEEANSVDASDPCHIDTIPTEVLLNVFSRLSPQDKVEVREVCSRWAQILPISSPTFSNSVTFTLSPGTDAYSGLMSSGANWKHVKITGLSTPESREWFQSLAIRSSVRRIVLRNSVFTRDFLQSSLLEFPHLEQLEFINSKMERGDIGVEGIFMPWIAFLRRLKSLTLEVGDSAALCNYLGMFGCPDAGLEKLVIRMNVPREGSTSDAMTSLRRFIRGSSSSLRDFYFTVPNVSSLEDLWKNCLLWSVLDYPEPRINPRWRTMDVTLSNPDPKPFLVHMSTRFWRHFFGFLQSQPDLTSFSLPPMTDMTYLTLLAACLPSKLETIHVGSTTKAFHLPLFIQKLSKVKKMTLYFLKDQFQDFNENLLDYVLPELESLIVVEKPGSMGFTLANSFPNLRTLVITCSSAEDSKDTLNDAELQLIIANLTLLTVLKLDSCARITDFGVAGIGQEEATTMLRQRTATGLDLDSLYIVRKGFALHDLQGLKELSLAGSSQISDVGIQFGFDFGNLQQFHLATAHRELTDWGLVRLARLNPRLERVHVETSHLADHASLEKAVATQLKSGGNWKRIDVSIKPHSEEPLKMVYLSNKETHELANLLHIVNEIRTYDNQANTSNDDGAAHLPQPAEVYRKWRDDKIDLLRALYPILNQAQKDLLSLSTALPKYADLF